MFMLPEALKESGTKIAEGLKQSITNGAGQFCTKPGLIFAVDDPATRQFLGNLATLMATVPQGTMLNPGIAKSFHAGQSRLTERAKRLTPARDESAATMATPSLFSVTADQFLADHTLAEEVFGPAALVILAKNPAQLEELATRLDGQLTATIHAAPGEVDRHRALVDAIQQRAGRLIFNGFFPPALRSTAPCSTAAPIPPPATAAARRWALPPSNASPGRLPFKTGPTTRCRANYRNPTREESPATLMANGPSRLRRPRV